MDRKRFARQLTVVLFLFAAALGLLWYQYREEQRRDSVEECLLSLERQGEFYYQDVSYTIQNQPAEPVGAAVGYIRQDVAFSETAGETPAAAQLRGVTTLRYGDVYLSEREGELAVEVNGTCLRAVPTAALSAAQPGVLTARK